MKIRRVFPLNKSEHVTWACDSSRPWVQLSTLLVTARGGSHSQKQSWSCWEVSVCKAFLLRSSRLLSDRLTMQTWTLRIHPLDTESGKHCSVSDRGSLSTWIWTCKTEIWPAQCRPMRRRTKLRASHFCSSCTSRRHGTREWNGGAAFQSLSSWSFQSAQMTCHRLSALPMQVAAFSASVSPQRRSH